jgi:hypothetical protein
MPRSPTDATSSGNDRYRDRHVAILRHVGLYRLTLKAAVATILADLGTEQVAGTALSRLVLDGLLVANNKAKGFSARIPYYTLTAKGASEAQVTPERAKPFGPAALRTHLAALWFCCLGATRRYRLEPDEWKNLFPDGSLPAKNPAAHCVTEEDGVFRVYRVYATDADPQETVRKIGKDIEDAWNKSGLRGWIESGEYGFAVLTPTPEAAEHLSRSFDLGRKGEPTLCHQARILVEHAPSPKTLKAALLGRGQIQ